MDSLNDVTDRGFLKLLFAVTILAFGALARWMARHAADAAKAKRRQNERETVAGPDHRPLPMPQDLDAPAHRESGTSVAVTCPLCHGTVPPTARFCRRCGRPVQTEPRDTFLHTLPTTPEAPPRRKVRWVMSLVGVAALLGIGVFALARRNPSSVEAASEAKDNPTLVWNVATGDGLPPATPSHSISLGANVNAPAWGPGRVTIRLSGGRTVDYPAEALSTFDVTDVGPEVRLRFAKQPLAAAHARAKTLLADWHLTNEPFYLDRWYAKRSDPNNRIPSAVWVSTMSGRVPAIVTLLQPKREEDEWVVVLQVFPRQLRFN
jgi:hypothetical protein